MISHYCDKADNLCTPYPSNLLILHLSGLGNICYMKEIRRSKALVVNDICDP